MRLLLLFMAICWGGAAFAATCKPGYYLDNGECKGCSTYGYYCPGDDSMIRCPDDTTDWIAEYTNKGYTVYSVTEPVLWSAVEPIGNIKDCHTRVYITVTGGTFHIEPGFDGTKYRNNYTRELWVQASTGYYLSPYYFTSWNTWYNGVKPCTNAPANAHYTGPGTPDAPDGSVTDANDCPWACDAGFGRGASNECLPLCGAGATAIRASSVSVPLFNEKHTAPALAVGFGDTVCYADLVLGSARPAINISYGGQIYHTVNE